MIAITMHDGSVKRMQIAPGLEETPDMIEDAIAKTSWAKQVKSWRVAMPEEFPAGCTWRDDGGKIVGIPRS